MPMDSLPRSVQLREGPGGLPYLHVAPTGGSGQIFLNGAHLTSWTPAGQVPVLWMSSTSRYTAGAPIRGGVPVCFPWFGRQAAHPDAPQHGFARLSTWELIDARERGDSVSVAFRLTDSAQSRASAWPHRFAAVYTVTIGAELQLTLEVENRDQVAFSYEAALHNYYAVGDARATRITGLEQLEYYTDGSTTAHEPAPAPVGNGISRRYPTAIAGQIDDIGNGRIISVTSEGTGGAVVWNPGAEIAQGLDDFADDEWTGMVCLETANIGESAIRLAPGERHTMRAAISLTASF